MKRSNTRRYSAALLFQFRVMTDGSPGKRRLCEKRIIHFRSTEGLSALAEAKRRGHAVEHDYKNSDGNRVFFEFIGVLELMCCDPSCERDEVWYELVEMLKPMERKRKLIPPESELSTIRNLE
jgi:hypothetical protein